MGEIEPFRGISADDNPLGVDAITPAGDFHSANKRGCANLGKGSRRRLTLPAEQEDEVVLSDVAHVSLLEEEGKSVYAIATGLGLTAATVLTDMAIASEICHPTGSARQPTPTISKPV